MLLARMQFLCPRPNRSVQIVHSLGSGQRPRAPRAISLRTEPLGARQDRRECRFRPAPLLGAFDRGRRRLAIELCADRLRRHRPGVRVPRGLAQCLLELCDLAGAGTSMRRCDAEAERGSGRSVPCPRYSTPPATNATANLDAPLEARKRQLYGRPYMRTDAINRFASSELCRPPQDGGKTPLTLEQCAAAVLRDPGEAPAPIATEALVRIAALYAIEADFRRLAAMHHNTQPHRAALAYARSRESSSVCDKTNASMMRATSLAC